jgi:hypothetical protein
MRVTWAGSGQLEIKETVTPAKGRARRGSDEPAACPADFLRSERVAVEKMLEISLPAAEERRRGGSLPVVALDIETEDDESALVVLRHPSQAMTFHTASGAAARRGGPSPGTVLQFRIPIRQARGLATQAIKATILKVARPVLDKIADFVLAKLARLWEEQTWSKRGLKEGWFRVIPPVGPGSLQMKEATPDSTERSLLLLHGTFSNAASAFGGLTGTDFFTRIEPLYGDRIFAFNHFSVSKSPADNVQALLSALPNKKHFFDVITHSRGGLVLRTIVEGAAEFGELSQRIQVGQVVLVASPNDGTPLATPECWDKTVGWVANLLEIIGKFTGENPFITAADFVSEAIVWLAHHVSGDLPGLRAMDAGGEIITDLQAPPAPPEHAYSALVANFQPDKSLLLRMVDVGVDQFFGGANDLVVPTEGGWRVDSAGGHLDTERIGCFGQGGNIAPGESSPVMHTSFFSRAETALFLANALRGQRQQLSAVNPSAPLPDHRFRGGVIPAAAEVSRTVVTSPGPKAAPAGAATAFIPPSTSAADTFHLIVLDAQRVLNDGQHEGEGGTEQENRKVALLYAVYAGARAVEPFGLRGGESGTRFHEIIGIHERIKDYTDRQSGTLPSDSEMIHFGTLLFETLFPGEVKRLYDTARSLQLQRNRKLDLVFTSMVSWVAEKPWEFAYDPARKSFLATEEIHFVRNVLTAVPGDPLRPRSGPLRILVVSAQPVGLAQLSVEEETEVVRRGFQFLIDGHLAEVEVLPRATVPELHGRLSTGDYNVVHFIGHGTFDEAQKKGYLVFEDGHGGRTLLDERSAREIFCQRGLDLIFLNACQTSEASPSEFNKGMAQALVAHGVPALVANQYSVLDVSATSFAQFFYWGLARGMTLGEAAREARIAVNYSLQGDAIDWAVPALYARDPNNSLTTGPAGIANIAAITRVAGERRQLGEQRLIRIGVWDVDHGVPALASMLAALNEVQQRFEFEPVNLSAPLDSFETNVDRGKSTTHFRVDRVARRLQSKASQMRADYLLCITQKPLVDENGGTTYEWFSAERHSSILVLSSAGFRDLEPSGVEMKLMLTNAIVGLLAQVLTEATRHSAGPTDCPLHANRTYKKSDMAAGKHFDVKCRKMFQRASPSDLPALEALLGVFLKQESPGKRSLPVRDKRTKRKGHPGAR